MIRIKPMFMSSHSHSLAGQLVRRFAQGANNTEKVTIQEAVKNIDNLLAGDNVLESLGSQDTFHHEGVQGDIGSTAVPPPRLPRTHAGLSPLPEGFQAVEYGPYGVTSRRGGSLGTGQFTSCGPLTSQARALYTSSAPLCIHHRSLFTSPPPARLYSTGPEKQDPAPPPVDESALSQTDKLKRAVQQYGATVVVFHVGISIISLGSFYLLVSSGVDMVAILAKLGVGQSILESKAVTGAGTFVVSYAVHKVFAPVRIAITLTSTPFIVRYLRRIKVLKPPKPSA